MMAAFLDALGIAHEDGLIAQDETPKPDPEKLDDRGRVASRERFPAGTSTLLLDAGAAGSARPGAGWRSGRRNAEA